MKNIIIGTAGHIDHGKTTLIKALTGRNTDRWNSTDINNSSNISYYSSKSIYFHHFDIGV